MHQRGQAKQALVSQVRRAQAWLAAFALQALQHGRAFAANVSPRAPAQHDARQRARRVVLQRLNLAREHGAQLMVFVTQIDVASLGAHHLRGNQHAFQKTVRVTLQVVAVFEGAGLALVQVHRQHFGCRVGQQGAPLACGGKARATQAAQVRALQRRQHRISGLFTVHHGGSQGVTALRTVSLVCY